MPLRAASHALTYVLPSQPQTRCTGVGQVEKRFRHVAVASAAPHSAPSVYAQYSSAAQVEPRRAPQPFPPGGAEQDAPVQAQMPPLHTQALHASSAGLMSPSAHSCGHALAVQTHSPFSQEHALQPSSGRSLRTHIFGGHSWPVHSHFPPEHEQVLQFSFFVCPSAQAGWRHGFSVQDQIPPLQSQVPHPSEAPL